MIDGVVRMSFLTIDCFVVLLLSFIFMFVSTTTPGHIINVENNIRSINDNDGGNTDDTNSEMNTKQTTHNTQHNNNSNITDIISNT